MPVDQRIKQALDQRTKGRSTYHTPWFNISKVDQRIKHALDQRTKDRSTYHTPWFDVSKVDQRIKQALDQCIKVSVLMVSDQNGGLHSEVQE